VFGHPEFENGDRVYTTRIVAINGREVTTRSGTVYTLGEVNPDYVEWCQKKGCHVPTEAEPIIMK
jgi:hypothetical protein